jgi:hypothetical protein
MDSSELESILIIKPESSAIAAVDGDENESAERNPVEGSQKCLDERERIENESNLLSFSVVFLLRPPTLLSRCSWKSLKYEEKKKLLMHKAPKKTKKYFFNWMHDWSRKWIDSPWMAYIGFGPKLKLFQLWIFSEAFVSGCEKLFELAIESAKKAKRKKLSFD